MTSDEVIMKIERVTFFRHRVCVCVSDLHSSLYRTLLLICQTGEVMSLVVCLSLFLCVSVCLSSPVSLSVYLSL